jgi:transcriptional regulator with XRE-family HTH domain
MFGDKVRFARKEMGLTQKEFSEKLGITRGYLSDIERGKIKGTVAMMNKLSEITDKPISFFMGKNIKVIQYETLDQTIDLLINNSEITLDGEISNWAKEMLLKVLEKEIHLKLERMSNNEKNSDL